ncbi:DUF1648 domain-containing protein [Saccharopolyspora sp. WRP15-2]|uniref:DUF1648 domain-containing protein n=1 Tax=Saccharopolyspora oryzae TaxID=2997343 RepID=A0ABT4V814_9PSEU|nr:DUF1648 domain-containing protein [Saccharopolyspora oryzae]MDA3629551.1 DUF1648 domain-containing protein [Saccharopolyspora oryzae]
MTYRTRFLGAAGLWVAAVTAALLVGAFAVRDRLPDPMATHWGISGAPDDSMPFAGHLVFDLVMWLIIAVVAVVVAVRGWERRAARASAAAILGAGAAFAVGMSALTTWANLDAAGWEQARSLPVWQVIPVLALAALVGWLGWWVGNRGPDAQPEEAGELAELTLKPGERAVWVSSVRSRTLLVIGGITLLVGVVSLALQAWPPALVLMLSGLLVLALSSARVQVDERGVRTSFGPLRWPVRRIRLEQIESARVEIRRATEVGGWGYRVLPHTTAIMLRGGECLALRLNSGRNFYISVDHPTRGAELVNALITERSAL